MARVTERRRRDLVEIASRMPPERANVVIESLRAFADAAGEPASSIDLFGWSQDEAFQ